METPTDPRHVLNAAPQPLFYRLFGHHREHDQVRPVAVAEATAWSLPVNSSEEAGTALQTAAAD